MGEVTARQEVHSLTGHFLCPAGTATVTREIADRINAGAAPHDRVTAEALTQRVRCNEGLKCQSDIIEPE